jgi:hypothetical protein
MAGLSTKKGQAESFEEQKKEILKERLNLTQNLGRKYMLATPSSGDEEAVIEFVSQLDRRLIARCDICLVFYLFISLSNIYLSFYLSIYTCTVKVNMTIK